MNGLNYFGVSTYIYCVSTKENWVKNKNSKNYKRWKYSVSCDLSAAPAPGQSTGPGERPALIETK
jgi:hypothetical protein